MDDKPLQPLMYWGRFWRHKGLAPLGYPKVNTICRMMQAAKLGCTPQTSRREPEIYVPPDLEALGIRIDGLRLKERRAVSLAYVDQVNRKTIKRKRPDLHRALLSAEARLYPYLLASLRRL